MNKILLADVLEQEGVEILQQHAQVDQHFGLSAEQLRGLIPDYDAVLVRANTKLDAETLACAKKLKVIGMPGAGLDHIDMGYAKEHGIAVCNVPGGNVDAVAELTLAHILVLLRNVWAGCSSVKHELQWNKYPFMGREATNRRLAILGFGRIGRRVAQLGQAFHMEVCAYDPYADPSTVPDGIKLLPLDELLAWGEIFTIHVPLTKETYHLVDREAIDKMQKGAYVINMSRGGLVDEMAICEALQSGQLSGAGGDVVENEPAPGEMLTRTSLLELPNYVVTPHLGAWTSDTQVRVAEIVAKKMLKALGVTTEE